MGVSGRFLRSHNLTLGRCLVFPQTIRVVRCCQRSLAVVSNPTADKALHAITGGRIESWLQKYEDLVGLTEVKNAQNKVIQAEQQFEQAQMNRRSHQQQVTLLHVKLKELHAALDKVQRGEERYLALLTEEYEVLRREKQIAAELVESERTERDYFAALSSAVRESHERERARAERTKYWSIIGSVIGATIGIVGTTINNYRRMRELKSLVRDSATGGAELSRVVTELVGATQRQQDELRTVFGTLKSTSDGRSSEVLPLSSGPTGEVAEMIRENGRVLVHEMSDVKRMIAASSPSISGGSKHSADIIYVGPEIKELFACTETNIESAIKRNAVASSVFLYVAGITTAAVVYAVLAGGGGGGAGA